MNTQLFKTLFLFMLLAGVTQPAVANDQNPTTTTPDEEQPVHITADSLDIQELTGISVYSGDVEVNQGSLNLKGDEISIDHPDRVMQSIKTIGNPAYFKRFDPESQSWVTGKADRIDYDAVRKIVILTGDAKVEQPGKHTITGPKLNYDMRNKTLKAQSTPQEKQRISVTLTPDEKPIQ